MKAQEGKADTAYLSSGSSPFSKPRFGWQSSGFPVQFPLGQSDASIAEHWPMQLLPWPHITLVREVSRAQQPTSIDSLEKVKAESKNSTSVVVALPFNKKIKF